MARAFSFSPDGYYHIYNRGVEKRTIFTDKNDYNRFVALLYLCNGEVPVVLGRLSFEEKSLNKIVSMNRGETLVDIGAWCLMPNHFHLLLHEKKEGGISAFMQKLQTAYTMYFNAKYKRTGALFEGRFRARVVNKEQYLEYLFAYIHLNPVKLIDPSWKEEGIADPVRAKNFLSTYAFSSYLDFFGTNRSEGHILERNQGGAFSEYFKTPKDFTEFLDNWLSYEEASEKRVAWRAIQPEEVKSEEVGKNTASVEEEEKSIAVI